MILRRLFLIVFILFAIISITYGMMSLVPGDTLVGERSLSGSALEEKIKQYKEKHNYVAYMKNIFKGDLGTSFVQGEKPIIDIIGPAIPVSFSLGFLSIALALILGLSCGLVSASFHQKPLDRMAMLLALIGLSIPAFTLGPLLQLGLGLEWKVFKIAGWWHPWRSPPGGSWTHMVLPALTLCMIPAATIARLIRSSMLEALRQDYMRTALAKGLTPLTATLRHGFKNACLPVISYLGPATAGILMGSIVVEQIFNIPGLGEHFIKGATNRDYEVVLGIVILYSALLLIFNLIVDILYTWIDPRIDLS